MLYPSGVTSGCPSDNALAAHCARGKAADPSLLSHLDECLICQTVVVALVHSNAHNRLRGAGATIRPQTLEVDDVLADRYEIVQLLGWGGMGEVYLAKDRQLNESVALKTLSIFKIDAPELAARLRGEAQLARKVTHPNVVRIFDFGTHRVKEKGTETLLPFLTMELLDGQTLGNRIRTQGPCPPALGIKTAIEILQGLGAVHAAGIVHRDLKPDNVFLTVPSPGQDAPRTVLTDFGLARSLGSDFSRQSQTGTIVGTLAYLSPEQLEGRPATKASDIYAFGVVFCELLTGQLPGSQPGMYYGTSDGTPQSALGLPGSLVRIVSKCLQRDPVRRYSNTETIIQDLTKALINLPASTTRTSLPGRRLIRRKAIVPFAAVAGLLASVAAWQVRQTSKKAVPLVVSKPSAVEKNVGTAYAAIRVENPIAVRPPSVEPVAKVDVAAKPPSHGPPVHPRRKEATPPAPSPKAPLSLHPDDVVDPFADSKEQGSP